MSKTNAMETSFLQLVFQAIPWAGMADNASSAPVANLYVSLHTADPGEGGLQTTSEANYSGYNRKPKARSAAGWTVSGNTASPASDITFDACTSGSNTITHFGVGTLVSGSATGSLLYKGTVSPSISVTSGVTPVLTDATAITED